MFLWTVAWSPDGTRLVTGSDDKMLRILSAETGRDAAPEGLTQQHKGSILTVAWSRCGNRIATGCNDKVARIVDVSTGETLHEIAHDSPVRSVSWTPCKTKLATGSGGTGVEGKARVIDTAT